MTHAETATVIGKDGLRGRLEAAVPEHDQTDVSVPVRLETGERIMVPADLLTRQKDGDYRASISFAALQTDSRTSDHVAGSETQTIPLIEEEVHVGKRTVERGRVRITKRVEHHEGTIDEPLLQEHVEVERVPIGREIDGPVEVRQEGDVTIIPIYEEVLVVEKRLVLKEELHIRKERQEVHDPQQVTLRREYVDVERIEGEEGTTGVAP
ncbi:MAG: YsnF/AvaK domain-containing protein [Rhodothermales bacterium]